jgi:hypothetical protein
MQKKVTDLSLISELTDNDPELMKKYIFIFLKNSPKAVHDLQQKIKEEDWVLVKQSAHAFKSQLSYMGMGNERKILDDIEEICAGKSDFPKIASLFSLVVISLEKAYQELNEFLSEAHNS